MTRRRMLTYLGAAAATLPVIGCESVQLSVGPIRRWARSFDVVIIGGTPSGVFAAMAAFRAGATVAVIEATQHIGGMYSSGLGVPNIGDPKTIGGLQKKFYQDVSAYYAGSGGPLYFEPHVAEQLFIDYMSANKVSVFFGRTVASVEKTGTSIVSLTLDNGTVIKGKQWIDASYEGDLMAASGASYTVGRESGSQYGEQFAGWGHQNVKTFSPSQWDGSLLPGLNADPNESVGQSDNKIMAYTFFACLTTDTSNMAPLPKPANYDPGQFAATELFIRANNLTQLSEIVSLTSLTHNDKYLVLFNVSSGDYISTDYAGASWNYPNSDWTARAAIWANHYDYVAGMLYFLANDLSVPASISAEMNVYGLAADEFKDNGNWPWQMYVREGRRLVGRYVMTESDTMSNNTKSDSVGLNNWPLDCHPCDVIATTQNGEPAIVIDGSTYYQKTVTYELPFSSMLPNASEVTNLAVTVCQSASHMAFSSLRVEPCYITMGEAAGTAAGIATRSGIELSNVDIPTLQTALKNYGCVINLPA